MSKLLLTCLITFVASCGIAATNAELLRQVREKISMCRTLIIDRGERTERYVKEFGMPNDEAGYFKDLGLWASNHLDFVCQNFNQISTNSLERTILLYAESSVSDECYITFLDQNTNLAIAGILSADELTWYQKGRRNYRVNNLIALWYDHSGVSNIIQKLMDYTGKTNYYSRVLSGEMKREVEEWILFGPESTWPPVRSCLDAYLIAHPNLNLGVEGHWSIPDRQGNEYVALANAMSGDYERVCGVLPMVTSNQTERILLIATGLQGNRTFQISCLESLTCLATSNKISSIELNWFSNQVTRVSSQQ